MSVEAGRWPVAWEGMRQAAGLWEKELGACQREVECLKYGVLDMPDSWPPPFRQEIAHDWSESERAFAEATIIKRIQSRVWEEISAAEAKNAEHVSTEFITQDSDGKYRSVAGLRKLSSYWSPRPKKGSTLEAFAPMLQQGDTMIAFDLQGGYHHLRLHPKMRSLFVVRFGDRYFRYIALPFGWRHSGYWFVRILTRFWTHLRVKLKWRVLDYIDDALVCPSSRRPSTSKDCRRATRTLLRLATRYGLRIHPTKGTLGAGSTRLVHLGLEIDTAQMTFGVPQEKAQRIVAKARTIMQRVRRNRRLVEVTTLRMFAGFAQSLALAVPDVRFRLRGVHDAIAAAKAGRYARLGKTGIRDVLWWRDLHAQLMHRKIQHGAQPATATVHTDASLGAWGATLSAGETLPGTPGMYEVLGYWDPELRRRAHITELELRTVRLSLTSFMHLIKTAKEDVVRLYTDNTVTMYVVNAMMSKSKTLMRELRLLHALLWRHGVRLDAQYLPSALNLYADRLSRSRRAFDYLPSVKESGVMEHQWIGASDYDYLGSWAGAEYVRPHLDDIPIALQKARRDGFAGVMLLPWWTGRTWWPQLLGNARCVHKVAAREGSRKRWAAACAHFSPSAPCIARHSREQHSDASWEKQERH